MISVRNMLVDILTNNTGKNFVKMNDKYMVL